MRPPPSPQGCGVLADIVMADVRPLIGSCFTEGWENRIAMGEVKATVMDYFGDFAKFLNDYFFKRLAVNVMKQVRCCREGITGARCTRGGGGQAHPFTVHTALGRPALTRLVACFCGRSRRTRHATRVSPAPHSWLRRMWAVY